MLKAIIFDLDGTLLNRDLSLKNFVEHQYDRYDAFQHVKKEVWVQRFIELDERGYVWKDRVYQSLIDEFEVKLDRQVLLDDYIEGFQYHCVGFPGMVEMLNYLKEKNLKLGVITNGYERFQDNNIQSLKISHYFEVILISEREGIRKPNPEIFLRAANELGVKPEESIYVGDHPNNDIEACLNVGMRSIWKKDELYNQPMDSTWTIKELSEIRDIVARLELKKYD
ncbi:L-2-haloalkanoic acid dehalogenase [Paenibacillus antarcticus]|uniref:L-2-haloalkanoic acid dehalogenase n=1 Tax=Paenibacillus antarcticus TaxID=253703 RepID=A0A168NK10_9BACL|nr:L-2-haloalkanoic acid dehalogenase [Paenibacillus antarcticus]